MLKKLSAISPILKSMAHDLGIEKEMALYQLKLRWVHLVGQTIAAHTAPEKMRFKTLTLRVDGSTWMHELTFLKDEIIQKINQSLGKGAIKTLHLKLGQLPPPGPKACQTVSPGRERQPHKEVLPPKAAAVIEQQLLSVSDHHLKEVIHKAMERHFRKGESKG